MSASNDKSEDQSQEKPTSQDHGNPFIAFRRYADEQMASMLQSFLGIPSVLNPHWSTTNEEAHRRLMESLGVLPSSRDESTKKPKKQTENGDSDFASSSHAYGNPLRCPYRPLSEQESDEWDQRDPLLVARQACFARFLKHSGYSPLNLEKDRMLGESNVHWRRAFEDLMDAQSNMSMGSYDGGLNEKEWITACTNRWRNVDPPFRSDMGLVENLQQRVLQEVDNDLLRMGCATKAPENDSDHDTELDMYEHMLAMERNSARASAGTSTTTLEKTPKAQSVEISEPKSKGVVSTLTTTERVVLPDGSTTTKRILRKRFSDGREESSESVHTTQAEQDHTDFSQFHTREGQSSENSSDRRKDQEKKGGWFWS